MKSPQCIPHNHPIKLEPKSLVSLSTAMAASLSLLRHCFDGLAQGLASDSQVLKQSGGRHWTDFSFRTVQQLVQHSVVVFTLIIH